VLAPDATGAEGAASVPESVAPATIAHPRSRSPPFTEPSTPVYPGMFSRPLDSWTGAITRGTAAEHGGEARSSQPKN
jgi:hypothetical protein